MNIKDDGIEFVINDIEEYYNDGKFCDTIVGTDVNNFHFSVEKKKPVEVKRMHRVVLNDSSKYPVDVLLQNPPTIAISTEKCKTVFRGRLMTRSITNRTFQITVNTEGDKNLDDYGSDVISDVEQPIEIKDLKNVEPPTVKTRRRHKHKHHHKHHHHKHKHRHHRHHHTTPYIQPTWMTPMMCPPMTSTMTPLIPMYTPYVCPSSYPMHMTHPHTCCHTHH